jgi:hypothetical protein
MLLTIEERILLLNLDTLPRQGNLVTLRILKEMTDRLGFTEEELKEFEITTSGDQVKWKIFPDGGEREIPLGDKALDMIREAIKTSSMMTVRYLPLAEKLGVKEEEKK